MVRYAAQDLPKNRKPLPSLEGIKTRRKLAEAMMSDGTSYAPVQHWTQGAARVAAALRGAYENKRADRQYGELQTDANDALLGLIGPKSITGGMPPVPASAMAPQPTPMTEEEASVGRFAQPKLSAVAMAMNPDLRGAPAAIRHNNPGAMWPGPSSQKFGATGEQVIGGGNKIASFPDPVSGAAAQFDLLIRKYAGLPLAQAIAKWSGGNSSPQYVQAISQATGLSPDTMLTPQMLSSPQVAVPLAKAMAQWEAGKPYPMQDDQWQQAHAMAVGGPQQGQQQATVQMADASGGVDRATLARLLSNPLTRETGEKLLMQQAKAGMSGGEEYGKTGTIVQDKDGNFYSVQFGANGTKKIEKLQLGANGLIPSRGVSEVDTGTGTRIINRSTGQDVRSIDKDLAGAEAQKQIGDALGKKIVAAPSDIAVADDALGLLDSIENDPYLDTGTGASSLGNVIWGSGGFDFQTKVDQATSGAFLSAIQQMRGMGALSNAEGQTATQAITRMKTAQSRDGFLSALSDYREIVRKGRERAQQVLKSSQGGTAQPQQDDGWTTLPNGIRIREKR